MRSSHIRLVLVVLLTAGVLSACGDDDGSSAASSDPGGGDSASVGSGDEEASGDPDAWPPADARGTGDAGTVTVDGVTYGIDATRTCDLTDFAAGDDQTRDVEIQGIGLADPDSEFSDTVEISIYEGTTSNPEGTIVGMRWDGPEGLYDNSAVGRGETWTSGSTTLDGPPVAIDGDPVSGDLSLRSSLGNPAVAVVAELARPDGAAVDCS